MLFLAIGVLVVCAILWQYRTKIYEYFGETHHPQKQELPQFINFNLTEKPVANYAPDHIYQWWQNGPDLGKYDTCDQYRCQTSLNNQMNALPCFNVSGGKYCDTTKDQMRVKTRNVQRQCGFYENSADYCSRNPWDTRCPGYWKYRKAP